MSKKKKFTVVAIILFLGLLGLGGKIFLDIQDKAAYERALNLAKSYESRGEYEKALAILESYLLDNSDNQNIQNLFNDISVKLEQRDLSKKNEIDSTIKDAENKAKEAEEENKLLESSQKEALEEKERLESSQKEAEEKAREALEEKAKLEASKKEAEEKTRKILEEKARQEKETIKNLLKEVESLKNKDKLNEAETLLKEVFKLEPENKDALKLKKEIDDRRKSLESQREREEREKKEAQIISLLEEGAKYLKENKLPQAKDSFEKVLLLDKDNLNGTKGVARVEVQRSKNNKDNLPIAINAVKDVLELVPRDSEFLEILANLYNEKGDYNLEIETLEKILQQTPRADLFLNSGIASYRLGQYTRALEYFNKALEISPNYPQVFYPMALTFEKLNQTDNRLASLEKSVKLRNDHGASFYELGRVLSDKGNYSMAMEAFRKANELGPDVIKYKIGLALGYYYLQNYNKSIEIYNEIVKNDNKNSEAFYNLSVVYKTTGDYSKALENISKAIMLEAKNPVYLYTIGEISEILGRDDNAMTYYLNALEIDNNYYKPFMNLANIYDRNGMYKEGLTLIKRAYALEKNDPSVRFSLGTLYLRNKEYDKAIVLLEEAHNNDPSSPLKLYNLSLAYTESGDIVKGEKGFRDVIDLAPEFIDAYYYLGQLLFTQERVEEAKTFFRKVLEIDPNSIYKDNINKIL